MFTPSFGIAGFSIRACYGSGPRLMIYTVLSYFEIERKFYTYVSSGDVENQFEHLRGIEVTCISKIMDASLS